jgi:hypothetical protein
MKSTAFSLPLAIALAATSLTGTALADEASFRAALKTLPPRYFADIPLAERDGLLTLLNGDNGPQFLDAKKGWLHFFSDGGYIHATSMIWAKELPRTAGKEPLILVHMAKPFAGSIKGEIKPAPDQTVVLEPIGGEWVDVTKTVIPAEVDMTMHFRTRREDTVIELAPWEEINRQDGLGKTYSFGKRTHDLRWTGDGFVVEKPAAAKLTNN